MAYFKVLAGDFRNGWVHVGSLCPKTLVFRIGDKMNDLEVVHISSIESLEIATKESVKKAGITIGWGAAGALALDPAGTLAGLMLGGRKKEITFVMKLKDGRKVLGKAKSKPFTMLQKAVF